MLRLVSSLIGKPVISQREGRPIARVSGVLLRPKTGKVVAFQTGSKDELVPAVDVQAYADDGIVVAGVEILQKRNELVQLRRDRDAPRDPLRLPVFSDRGRRLGRIHDCTLDTVGDYLQKIHVRQPFWRFGRRELIIPRESIVRFEPGRVVVRYDGQGKPVGWEPEAAS